YHPKRGCAHEKTAPRRSLPTPVGLRPLVIAHCFPPPESFAFRSSPAQGQQTVLKRLRSRFGISYRTLDRATAGWRKLQLIGKRLSGWRWQKRVVRHKLQAVVAKGSTHGGGECLGAGEARETSQRLAHCRYGSGSWALQPRRGCGDAEAMNARTSGRSTLF